MIILELLQINLSGISKTTLHQINLIITPMLSMTGRITMLGLYRWAGDGGSYRTIQRFYMVRQCGLHLFSMLLGDAALCFPYSSTYKGSSPHCKYGNRVDYQLL